MNVSAAQLLSNLPKNSWPFEEAKRIYDHVKGAKKDRALFETGYGPSGLPHIGTFGEVVRTSFVRYAFGLIAPEIPTKLLCVSDDIDGLRKVPTNLPNPTLIQQNLGKPLTSVPDPFGTHPSYGHHMNSRLRTFLDQFGFDYEFVSATEKYQSGAYDSTMIEVLKKYDEIMDLMLPTLGAERQSTYSPFMPIDRDTGIVIDKGVKAVDKVRQTVIYLDKTGQEKEVPVTGGNCKLQWKVDFGARWYTFKVDYEIYGKDHLPNEKIYRRICEILGGIPPVNFCYEMFLNQEGAKISKSTGNGISVEDWLRYAPQESLSLFMYQKPKTAKRLYFDVIPKAMDDYLAYLATYFGEDEQKRLENPVFYLHFGEVPTHHFNLNYSLLLNLARACNPENESVLWGFIAKYQLGLAHNPSPLLQKMVSSALNYYRDFIQNHKTYRPAADSEKSAILALKNSLGSASYVDSKDPQALQNLVFEVGKQHGYEKNMREWFLALYQILLGCDQGPRMGSFIALFGVADFCSLIEKQVCGNP